jgi:hypothetical protein
MLCHEIFLAAEENSMSPGSCQTGLGQANSVSTPERWIAILYTVCLGTILIEGGHQRDQRGVALADCWETAVNWDSTSTVQMKGILPWLVRWAFTCPYKRFLSSLGCSSRPNTKYLFPHVHYFNSFVPTAQQVGQAVVLVRLSLSMCIWRVPL